MIAMEKFIGRGLLEARFIEAASGWLWNGRFVRRSCQVS